MKNILILDDNREIREGVASHLPKHVPECRVLVGADGAQGETILRSTSIDFILTDLVMPGMNGYAVIELVKRHFPALPVCVMSANCGPDIIARLLSMGVHRWIQKPFKFDVVARMVAEELKLEYTG